MNTAVLKYIEKPETGGASLLVSLSDSVVTIRHGDDGDILRQGRVTQGAWGRIFEAITNELNQEHTE